MCFTNVYSAQAHCPARGLRSNQPVRKKNKRNVHIDSLNSQMVAFTRLQQFVSIKCPLTQSVMYMTEAESQLGHKIAQNSAL